MTEQLASPSPGPRRENLEYFQGSRNMPPMEEHLERGVTPTNNFKNWFLDDEEPDRRKDGSPNPKLYKNQPWGEVMEDLRMRDEVLWKECKNTALVYRDAAEQHLEAVFSGQPESEADDQFREAAYWEMAGKADEAFRAILPDLEAAGIDPLDLCK